MSSAMRASQEPVSLVQRYDPLARTFHWLVVLLLLAQYTTKLILPFVLPKSAEDSINAWHLSIGSTILLVMLLRLVWRLTHRPPPPPADLPPGLRLLSRANHWAFYIVLILLPLLGWIAANAYGATVYLAGLVPLPALTAPDKAFAEQIGPVHGSLALLLLALIALHIAGALYHAVVKRDGVAQRMLPTG
jgi:cytochrome b561